MVCFILTDWLSQVKSEIYNKNTINQNKKAISFAGKSNRDEVTAKLTRCGGCLRLGGRNLNPIHGVNRGYPPRRKSATSLRSYRST